MDDTRRNILITIGSGLTFGFAVAWVLAGPGTLTSAERLVPAATAFVLGCLCLWRAWRKPEPHVKRVNVLARNVPLPDGKYQTTILLHIKDPLAIDFIRLLVKADSMDKVAVPVMTLATGMFPKADAQGIVRAQLKASFRKRLEVYAYTDEPESSIHFAIQVMEVGASDIRGLRVTDVSVSDDGTTVNIVKVPS